MFRVNLYTGELCLTVVDIYLPSQLTFLFSHSYSSSSPHRGSCFGDRWSHPYEYSLVTQGASWSFYESSAESYRFEFLGPGADGAKLPFVLSVNAARERVVRRTADGMQFHFPEATGKMPVSSIQDRFGNRLVFEYDSQGRIVRLIDPVARQLAFRHQGDRLVQVSLERHGRQKLNQTLLECEFNALGELVRTADRHGATRHYQYDQGQLVAHTNPLGGTYAAEYESTGRCIRTWECDGNRSRQFDFDPVRRTTRVTNGLGEATLHRFSEQGAEVEIVDALGERTEFLRDGEGRLLAEIGPSGTPAVMYVQRTDAMAWSQIAASGAATTYEQDAQGRVVKIVDACGHEWSFAHDDQGSVQTYRTPNGFETDVQHDAGGNVRSVRYPDGSTALIDYDPLNTKTKIVRNDGSSNETSFDSYGRIVGYQSTADPQVAIQYEGLDSIVTFADHSSRRYRYDGMGNLVQFEDERRARWQYRYDKFGRFLSGIDPLGFSYSYEYDGDGRTCAVRNENGVMFRSFRDACGRITQQQSFAGEQSLFELSRTGDVTCVVDATGQRLQLERDAAGLIIAYDDGLHDPLTRTYDPLGRLTNSQDGDVVLEQAFDGEGRCVTQSVNGHLVQFEFGWLDAPVRIATPSHAVSVTYDSQVRLASLSCGEFALAVEYQDLERTQTTKYACGIQLVRRFSNRNRLTDQTISDDQGRILREEQFEYDASGNLITKRQQPGSVLGFDHNARGDLIRVRRAGQVIRSFQYDGAGNRTQLDGHECRLGPGNQLLGSPGLDYEYDNVGRVIQRNQRTTSISLDYGPLGQVARVRKQEEGETTYEYDALFRRVHVLSEQGQDSVTWAGDVPFEQSCADGTRLKYVFHPVSRRPLAVAINDQWHIIVTDYRGEATELIRIKDHASVWRSEPLGFESEVIADELAVPFALRGLGQIYDRDTGLTYQRARYYDSSSGRFLTPDPLGPVAGLNLYQFCFNQPFQYVDPLGLCPPGTADECEALFNTIQNKRSELEERWDESANPKKILPWDGSPPVWADRANNVRGVYSAAHSAADGSPIAAGDVSSGSVKSHIDQYEAVQRGMNKDMQEYYCKGCPQHEDSARGNAMKQNAEWSSKQMHLPKYPPAPPSIASRVTQ